MPSSPSSAEAPGRVVSGHGRRLVVEASDGSRVLCHTRGKKSEAVVGDRVRWQASGDEGVIDAVLPRTNLLYRQDDWKTKAFAANIDQLLVVVAAEPVFSESQLARALIAADEARIPGRGSSSTSATCRPSTRRASAWLRMPRYGIEVLEMALKKDARRCARAPRAAARRSMRRWCSARAAPARARWST